ncbi:MAG: hypothetical protein DRG78_14340 [Epsilonproteobacteria bacterium]|nr:MAG: hypothetical protein DRG78_14340 [Campylobacterota bacterium]
MKLKIKTEQDVIHCISKAKKIALESGMNSVKSVEMATIVSELGYNIIKYAKSGIIIMELLDDGILVSASDSGTGIENIDKVLIDGFSSSGTLGLGIPGIIRLSDDFDIKTSRNGTKITIVKRFK